MNDKPLVSFCIITYNQERFVREAVEGALQQTYQPLEIVISDDASPDRTYAIVQETVAAYRGPHRVVARRNERNLGLTANVNAVVEASHGELILLAGGDDISLPERTARTVARWMEAGCPRGSLCTGYREINADGELQPVIPPPLPPSPVDLSEWVRKGYPLVNGAAHAFHRDLYRVFGPLKPDRWSEDMPLAMRALALDGVFYIPEPLVLYRRHTNNIAAYIEDRRSLSQAVYEEHRRYLRRAGLMAQVLEDFQNPAFAAKWGKAAMGRASRTARRVLRDREVMSAWMAAGVGTVAPGTLWKAWSWPPMVRVGCRLLLRTLLPRLQSTLFAYRDRRWKENYNRRNVQ